MADRGRSRLLCQPICDSGFRGSLNRYRNSERDFEQLAAFDGKPITQPTPFSLAVSMPFCAWYPGVDMVELMRRQFTDLRYVRLIEDAGRWLQQEWPAEVNAALLEFFFATFPRIDERKSGAF
jgi:pimeloyl-ACP methyl ester carboxylesterase